ncbi:unnamed protein product [Linum tenue]|uniref:glucan endo-1,3-beta-D-glucosidase n=1 Tax=Linum tenue TaxID=586396 RepID=A0AAV0JR36_9ROSI|nr:unnamed protein product [Linum tenue]
MDALLKLFHLLLLSLSSTLSAPSTSSASVIGVTYTSPLPSPPSSSTDGNSSLPTPPPQQRAHPEKIVSAVSDLRFGAVRLTHPDPNLVRAFAFTNTSLLLSIPNGLLPPLASNRTLAVKWLRVHVLPFYPRSKIATISVGEDAVAAPQISILLPAIRNVHLALRDIGIRSISVSTTFSFIKIVTTAFPPSAATFQEPIGEAVIRPLLQFLEDTNSSFLVNLYPYNMYRLHFQIPLGLALFQGGNFNFRDDLATGVRYLNLFDMMVDAVVTSMAVAGHENIPLVVAETGWPSSAVDSAAADADANPAYAKLYLKSLVAHLISGKGTPLRKDGVAQAYIYELVESDPKQQLPLQQGAHNWGILHPNMSKKYHFDFSSASRNNTIPLGRLLLLSTVVLASLLYQ